MDSDTDFASARDYNEFSDEIPFVSDIMQPFQL